jgi:YD repeat-containing protein
MKGLGIHRSPWRTVARGAVLAACALTAYGATTLTYTYDALGRLTYVNDPTNGNRDYDYDKAGNRLLVSVGTASDAAAEPPPPGGGGVPMAPSNLTATYLNNCNWLATWSAPGGQTYFEFKETATASRIVSGSAVSTGVTCTLNDPNSNKPAWIKACNANGCSSQANF